MGRIKRSLYYRYILKNITSIGFLSSLTLFGATTAQANLPSTSEVAPIGIHPLLHSGEAKAPYGWVDFCKREPSECAVNTHLPDKIRLSPERWRTINETNQRINRLIQPVTDQEHWGKIESWDIPHDGKGDCEDYVLLKRQELASLGISRRALLVTVVIDENDEGHAVLMVRTDKGDLILDNKHSLVKAWHETGYIFVKRERQDQLGWTSLGGVGSPEQVAAR